MDLTGKEISALRANGNKLKPEVWVGKEGITDGTLNTIENSFRTKELLKIKFLDSLNLEKNEAAEILARKTGSEIVQILGNTILLYKEMENS